MTTTAEQQWATKADVAEVRVEVVEVRVEVAKLETGLRADMATKQDVAELRVELRESQRDTNRRIDRVFYGMLAVGAGMIAAILAGDFLA